MTLLSLGKQGYMNICKERKLNYNILKQELEAIANKYDCHLLECKGNRISLTLSIGNLNVQQPTQLGSMLYTRGISGSRVIAAGSTKTIDNVIFKSMKQKPIVCRIYSVVNFLINFYFLQTGVHTTMIVTNQHI